MKASTISRIGAVLIDSIIIAILVGIVTGFLPTTEKYDDAYERQKRIVDKVFSGESDIDNDELYEIKYDLDKESIHITLVTTVIYLAYFGTFAYYNHGQTLGKKLLHIKVEAENDSNMTFIFRSALIYGVFTALITTVGVLFLDKTAYATLYGICSIANFLIVLISFIFCAAREDGKGLHDLLFKTSVIKE